MSGNFIAHIGYYENNLQNTHPNGGLLICVLIKNDLCEDI